MRNAAKIAMWGGKSLPYKKRLEYIANAESYVYRPPYVDTGIIPTINVRAEIDLMTTYHVGWAVVIGSQSADNSADAWLVREGGQAAGSSSTGYSCRIGGVSRDNAVYANVGNRILCKLSKSAFVVDGTSKNVGATQYSTQPTLPLFLFSGNLNGSQWAGRGFIGRIYACKIFDVDLLIADYIPVLDLEGNPKMFDIVTQSYPTHYGSFVAGPAYSGGGV